jgi:hypothetical protein
MIVTLLRIIHHVSDGGLALADDDVIQENENSANFMFTNTTTGMVRILLSSLVLHLELL